MKKTTITLIIGLLLVLALAACSGAGNVSESTSVPPSITPTETIMPTLIPTRKNTLTPGPSETPTQTSMPTSTPTQMPITIANLPTGLPESYAYDLVWVQDGSLLFWDAHNDKLITMVGQGEDAVIQVDRPVIHAETRENGMSVVVVSTARPDTYILLLVNIWARTSQKLTTVVSVREEPNYPNFSLSPDERWLAFYNIQDQSEGSYLYNFNVIDLETLEEKNLAVCVDHPWNWSGWCQQAIVWNSSSDRVAVHAEGGLWSLDPEVENRPRRTASDDRVLLQADRWSSAGTYLFPNPLAWSPNGEFVLVRDLLWESTETVVVNSSTGVLDEVPDSFESYGTNEKLMLWLEDGRLIVFHFDEEQITVLTYLPQSSEEQMLSLENLNKINIDYSDYEQSYARQVSENELFVVLNFFDSFSILRLDLDTLEVISISEPLEIVNNWNFPSVLSPDAEWLFSPGAKSLMSIDGEYSFDLRAAISDNAFDFVFVLHED